MSIYIKSYRTACPKSSIEDEVYDEGLNQVGDTVEIIRPEKLREEMKSILLKKL